MQEPHDASMPWATMVMLVVGVAATLAAVAAVRENERASPSPDSASTPSVVRSAPSVLRPPLDLAARCRTLTPVGGDERDRDAACAAILTPDGQGFALGSDAFRRCRDGIMTDWLPDVQSTRSLPPALIQLEASFACRHLL